MTLPSFRSVPNVERVLDRSVYLLGLVLSLWLIYYAVELPVSELRFANVFLGVGLLLFYLSEAKSNLGSDSTHGKSIRAYLLPDRIRTRHRTTFQRLSALYCVALGLTAIVCVSYVHLHIDRFVRTAIIVGYRPLDILVGGVIIYLSLDATIRAYGWAMGVIGLLALAYPFLGPYLFGVFQFSGMELNLVIRKGALEMQGVYGFILRVGSTWVAIFLVFAGLAKAHGLLDFLTAVGNEIKNKLHTGIVHVAVITSLVMGSITGSAAANTATTGSFTIPMMKDQGVPKTYATAIESVASSGGQLMPPVMGVAAFLMADFLAISYVRVMQAAIIPAMLFYLSTFVAVHFVVLKGGWTTTQTGSFDARVLLTGAHFAIPFAVLLHTLVVWQYTPLAAGLWTIGAFFVVALVKDLVDTRQPVRGTYSSVRRSLDGLSQGAQDMAPLVGILGSLGFVLTMITQTGLSQRLSFQLVSLAGGVFVLLLLLGLVASILFGMGMPTPAAYILVVILIAPGMINEGVPRITAHMFVFYAAVLSAITPPVAIAIAVGARIADAPFLASARKALLIGAPGFIIPFTFVYNNSLIYWEFPVTIVKTTVIFVGLIGFVIAAISYNGRQNLTIPRRLLYGGLAFLAMFAWTVVQVAAALVILILVVNTFKFDETPVLSYRPGD